MRSLILSLLLLVSLTAAAQSAAPTGSNDGWIVPPGGYNQTTFVDPLTDERLAIEDSDEEGVFVTYASSKKKEVALKVLSLDRRQHRVVVTFPNAPKTRYTITVDASGGFATSETSNSPPQRFYPPERATRKLRLDGPGCGSMNDLQKGGVCNLVELDSGKNVVTVRTCKSGDASCENAFVTLGKLLPDRQYVLVTENPMDPTRLTVYENVLGSKKLDKVADVAATACVTPGGGDDTACRAEQQRLEEAQKRYGR